MLHMIIKKWILIGVMGLGLCGCDNYLDITPKGLVIPQTLKDFREMMNNYDGLAQSSCNVYYVNDNIKLYKDDMGFIYDPTPYVNGYCWNDYLYDGDELEDRDWNKLYSQIHICNAVLKGIDKADGHDEEMRKTVKGEALAHRAFAYFMLVNEYGRHYDKETAQSDLAVPLYLEDDVIGTYKERASIDEVYTLIIQDFLLAEKLVGETSNNNFKPTKAGVRGALSLVYLYLGNWKDAATYADEALKTNAFLYKFADMDYIMPTLKWMGVAGYPTTGRDNKEVVWHKHCIDPMIYVANVYMSDELHSMYKPGDRRLYFTQIDAGMFGPNKYGDCIFNMNQGYYKCGITTPLLYLIRAEANIRQGNRKEAVDDLNTLRENRMNNGAYTPYNYQVFTDEEILVEVLEERRKELFLECWRWFDMKRLNKDSRFAKTITREFDGQFYTLKPESDNYVMAIPKNVCNFNTLIQQNKRGK